MSFQITIKSPDGTERIWPWTKSYWRMWGMDLTTWSIIMSKITVILNMLGILVIVTFTGGVILIGADDDDGGVGGGGFSGKEWRGEWEKLDVVIFMLCVFVLAALWLLLHAAVGAFFLRSTLAYAEAQNAALTLVTSDSIQITSNPKLNRSRSSSEGDIWWPPYWMNVLIVVWVRSWPVAFVLALLSPLLKEVMGWGAVATGNMILNASLLLQIPLVQQHLIETQLKKQREAQESEAVAKKELPLVTYQY